MNRQTARCLDDVMANHERNARGEKSGTFMIRDAEDLGERVNSDLPLIEADDLWIDMYLQCGDKPRLVARRGDGVETRTDMETAVYVAQYVENMADEKKAIPYDVAIGILVLVRDEMDAHYGRKNADRLRDKVLAGMDKGSKAEKPEQPRYELAPAYS